MEMLETLMACIGRSLFVRKGWIEHPKDNTWFEWCFLSGVDRGTMYVRRLCREEKKVESGLAELLASDSSCLGLGL